jgi:glucose/arabinose dehydrogenase
MTGMRHRLLWIIVGLEAAIMAGLIVWTFIDLNKTVEPQNDFAAHMPAKNYKPPVIASTAFAKGLATPTSIATTDIQDDSRLFVTEQAGMVRAVNNKGEVSAPVLNIASKVLNNGEMGLLGIAFHPKFQASHYVYVYYINKAQQSVVARYTMDPAAGTADPASEKVLLTLQQTYNNHKGGQLQFGADGYLYIAIGDGGSAGDPNAHGQDLATWFGKILRIDVDHGDPYAVPATNPFAHSSNKAVKPEIWAYGLRNPWRFSFDSKTQDLYIADVGQDAYEEIDVQGASSRGGENYGWRCYESLHTFNTAGCKTADKYAKPVLEYSHDNNRCSITGGYVYRGTAEPALFGAYIYSDYCTGETMVAMKQNNAWKVLSTTPTGHNISTFGQDNAGELYYADSNSGEIFHITDSAN